MQIGVTHGVRYVALLLLWALPTPQTILNVGRDGSGECLIWLPIAIKLDCCFKFQKWRRGANVIRGQSKDFRSL